MSATVERIPFGAIVKVPDSEKVPQPQMVMHCCGKDASPAFYDATCDLKLANLGNLMIHLEDHADGVHRVVAFCKHHRWFEAIGDDHYAELRDVGMVLGLADVQPAKETSE